MRKGLTELVFILDRSGSMSGLESDVIGGFNSVIEKQRKLEGNVLVSTVLFDNEIEILHDREDIDFIEPLTEEEYYTRGCTALLDAVGGAIKHISRIHKYAREEDRPEHVMFFINTDGYENSSHKYSFQKIKTMIDIEKEKYDWEFVFMGANIDAFDVAERMGISRSRAVNVWNDGEGIERNYGLIDNMVSACRSMSREAACMCMDELCVNENSYTEDRKREQKKRK